MQHLNPSLRTHNRSHFGSTPRAIRRPSQQEQATTSRIICLRLQLANVHCSNSDKRYGAAGNRLKQRETEFTLQFTVYFLMGFSPRSHSFHVLNSSMHELSKHDQSDSATRHICLLWIFLVAFGCLQPHPWEGPAARECLWCYLAIGFPPRLKGQYSFQTMQ